MKRFGFFKVLGILVLVCAAVALFGFIVMSLWNGILVGVLHVGVIDFWQALGILILSKILFGGFHGKRGGWRGRGGPWRKEMMQKWSTMTPEERQKFKQEFRSRCRGDWRDSPVQNEAGESTMMD